MEVIQDCLYIKISSTTYKYFHYLVECDSMHSHRSLPAFLGEPAVSFFREEGKVCSWIKRQFGTRITLEGPRQQFPVRQLVAVSDMRAPLLRTKTPVIQYCIQPHHLLPEQFTVVFLPHLITIVVTVLVLPPDGIQLTESWEDTAATRQVLLQLFHSVIKHRTI
jgi:hypothetical protein